MQRSLVWTLFLNARTYVYLWMIYSTAYEHGSNSIAKVWHIIKLYCNIEKNLPSLPSRNLTIYKVFIWQPYNNMLALFLFL